VVPYLVACAGVVLAIAALASDRSLHVERELRRTQHRLTALWDLYNKQEARWAQFRSQVHEKLNRRAHHQPDIWYPSFDGRVASGPTQYRVDAGIAKRAYGDLVLYDAADVKICNITVDNTEGCFSLRKNAMQSLMHGGFEPSQKSTDLHDLPALGQTVVLDPTARLLCDTAVIGSTCAWRTDWLLPTCHPTAGLCACPVRKMTPLYLRTLYWRVPVAQSSYFYHDSAQLCTPDYNTTRGELVYHWLSEETVTPLPDAPDYRFIATVVQLQQPSTQLRAHWPPLLGPRWMENATSELHVLVVTLPASPACSGETAYIHRWDAQLRLATTTCERDNAARWRSGPDDYTVKTPDVWSLAGLAFALYDDIDSAVWLDLCLLGNRRLAACSFWEPHRGEAFDWNNDMHRASVYSLTAGHRDALSLGGELPTDVVIELD
jgi:hypothetical protein